MILVVAPEICRTGGVQAFSTEIIAACIAIFGESRVMILSRNDLTQSLSEQFPKCGATRGLGRFCRVSRKILLRRFAQKLIRRHHARCVICTHPQMIASAVGSGIPVIGVCHGIDVWNPGRSIRRDLERADRLLSVSRFTQEQILRKVPNLVERISIFPNTYDESRFHIGSEGEIVRPRLGIPEEAFILLAVARLDSSESAKGYDDVIRSLPTILATRRNTYFVLGGSGDDLPRVRHLAEELGVIDHCRFPGFIESRDLPALYRSADLFVLPSRKEGFGIVFIEALACGTPVIAGNADGSRDAVLDGEIGTLVTPGDRNGLVEAIFEHMNRPAQIKEFEKIKHSHRVAREFGRHRFQQRLRMHLADLGVLPPERSGRV